MATPNLKYATGIPRKTLLAITHLLKNVPAVAAVVLLIGLAMAATARAQTATTQADPALSHEPPLVASSSEQLVSIDFNNVDIGVFVKFMSDLTKRNFVVDNRVRGKVTIISPGKITVAEAYKVFESVLEVHGFSAVPAGEVTKIIPAPDARTKNIKTRLETESGEPDDSVVTQIIPLRYADPEEVKRLFTPLVSRNSVIITYAPTNTLIITDVYSNIRRLLKILKSIDITGVGQQIALIPVQYSDAAKLVTLLTAVFQPPQKARAPAIKDVVLVADERTNVIVVMASEGDVDNIRKLVKSLDKETPKSQSKIHVYYLENASAEELVKVLMDLPQKAAVETSEQDGGRPTAPLVSEKVRITADKATNSLIIVADMEDYLVLESIIRKIDIPRAMVYIEALIMEVNVEKDFKLGTEWLFGDTTTINNRQAVVGGGFSSDNPLVNYGTAGGASVPVLPPGMSLGVFGEALKISGISFPSISAVVQAYKKDRDVRILSTPQILTTDNQEAKIYVGKNVPFQTTATASTTGTEIYNSYEYRDVGKTLKITPQISKDRQVRLELSLEVTALESAADNRPTTLKRTVETTAVVQDGNTVVLGGLIDDTEGVANYGVPCLGDVPGIGLLFRSKATAGEKSNLYVFLTPRVLQQAGEIEQMSLRKREEIDSLNEDSIRLYERKRPATTTTPPPIVHPQADSTLIEPSADASADTPTDENDMAAQDPTELLAGQKSYDPFEALEDSTPASSTEPGPSRAPATVPTTTAAAAPRTTDNAKNSAEIPSANRENDQRGFTLQVAAVKTPQEADILVRELMENGYAAYAVRSQTDGQIWYRLRIGYFANRAEADPVIARLRAQRYSPLLIKL